MPDEERVQPQRLLMTLELRAARFARGGDATISRGPVNYEVALPAVKKIAGE